MNSNSISRMRFNSLINRTDDVEIKWVDDLTEIDCQVDAVDAIGITHALTAFVLFRVVPKADDLTQLAKWFNGRREGFDRPRRMVYYHPSHLLAPIERIGGGVPQMSYNESVLTQLLKNPLVLDYKNKKLTTAEYEAFKRQYSLTDANMTRISVSDPVCRFMGLVVGDVLQVERRGTNEVSVRLVS